MSKQYCVYILTNFKNTVLYTGVTSELKQRIWKHKNEFYEGFTKRYNVKKLVYYEIYDSPSEAIKREKQIKAGSRENKIQLVMSKNPEWNDLYDSL